METITKEQKTEEQRMKENAEYLAHLKTAKLKKQGNKPSGYLHLAGSISKETAEKMLKHVENERNSW